MKTKTVKVSAKTHKRLLSLRLGEGEHLDSVIKRALNLLSGDTES